MLDLSMSAAIFHFAPDGEAASKKTGLVPSLRLVSAEKVSCGPHLPRLQMSTQICRIASAWKKHYKAAADADVDEDDDDDDD